MDINAHVPRLSEQSLRIVARMYIVIPPEWVHFRVMVVDLDKYLYYKDDRRLSIPITMHYSAF